MPHATLLQAIRTSVRTFEDGAASDPAIYDAIGDAQIVLIGEASHGTHEFYRDRARITRKLVRDLGFRAVVIEGDWPDAFRVNRWVQGHRDDEEATDALTGFQRFPTWMWRNADVLDFVGWLRDHNELAQEKVGFYGMDLYSLFGSIRAVLAFLERRDPELAREARERYACFERFGEDAQAYGQAASFGIETCEDEAVQQLLELRERAARFAGDDSFFSAEQNARLASNAEAYYRTMYQGRVSSWNLRDRHMFETLEAIADHHGPRSKLVVWAHNSHLGDARATQFARQGELNVGQLVREKYGRDAVLIGFTTHSGTVTAAFDWEEPAERKRVNPSLEGSYERLFHDTGLERFWLDLRDLGEAASGLREPRLERAIGVIYRPDTERFSHYFDAVLPEQFDLVIHHDHTRAVEPLERTPLWTGGEEPPETYPSGI